MLSSRRSRMFEEEFMAWLGTLPDQEPMIPTVRTQAAALPPEEWARLQTTITQRSAEPKLTLRQRITRLL